MLAPSGSPLEGAGAAAAPSEEVARREDADAQLKRASVFRLSELPTVGLFHSPRLGEILCALLTLTNRSLSMTCYCFDMKQGLSTIDSLLRRNVQVHFLVDANQMKCPSCKKQHDGIIQLFEEDGTTLRQVISNVWQCAYCGFREQCIADGPGEIPATPVELKLVTTGASA